MLGNTYLLFIYLVIHYLFINPLVALPSKPQTITWLQIFQYYFTQPLGSTSYFLMDFLLKILALQSRTRCLRTHSIRSDRLEGDE